MSWYRLENIKIREDIDEKQILEVACNKYHVKDTWIKDYRIYKKSIDARNKADVHYNYTIDVLSNRNIKGAKLIDEIIIDLNKIKVNRQSSYRPVIVGSGPAGLFCALTLAYNGVKPIVIERGKQVEERQKDVEEFWKNGRLNINSNAQFGEGGAGTFSDGKLTTNLKDPLINWILNGYPC